MYSAEYTKLKIRSLSPTRNVAAERIAFLLCIWEIPGSDLCPETDYILSEVVMVFLSPSKPTP
jgi:hypothetical protein